MFNSLRLPLRGFASKVTTEVFDDTVLAICINRPEKRNAVDRDTAEGLVAAFERFEKESKLESAILHGAGGTFCAGYDLRTISEEQLPQISAMLGTKHRPMGPSQMRLSKPLIAAIDGYAVAGGMELALLADMRVMESDAVMGVFCRRFGVPLLDGGTVRLAKVIGFGRAMELVLTGREVSAKEAHNIGLANDVCDIGTALGTSLQLARRLRKFPQKCMLADRRSLYYSTFDAMSEADAFDFELRGGLEVLAKESVSGADRFARGVGRGGSFDLDKLKGKYRTKKS